MTSGRSALFRVLGALVWACALAGAAGGCAPGPDGDPDSFGIDFSLPAAEARAGDPGRAEGALVFVVDGVGSEAFERMLAGGELPAIKKHFVDRGLYVPRAVANTPSVTLANLTSLTTGLFPGHHGVAGNNWFDRNQLVWRNYETIGQKNLLDEDHQAKTLYEHFPDRTTVSVFFQPHRGATRFFENRLSAGPAYAMGWYEFVDRLTLYRLNDVADLARQRGRWPAMTVCYLLAPDFEAYGQGAHSEQYRHALRHADRQIGRVLGDLARAGLRDRIVLALTSDHGMGDVTEHFALKHFFRHEVDVDATGKRLWESTAFEDRLKHYQRHRAVMCGSGDRHWALCLRKPNYDADGRLTGFAPWPVRPEESELRNYPVQSVAGYFAEQAPGAAKEYPPDHRWDLARLLLEARGGRPVDVVACRIGPGAVRVRRRNGEVEFRQPAGRGGKISYHLIAGKDPLGWTGKVPPDLLAGTPAGGRAWLEATCETNYPDLPAQILAYFRSRRAGDLVVFAAPGWDFNSVHRAGHGGLGPGDMHVPLLLAGPGVPKKTLSLARTVDLMPTLLGLLGKPIPGGLDGLDLLASPGRTRNHPAPRPRGATGGPPQSAP